MIAHTSLCQQAAAALDDVRDIGSRLVEPADYLSRMFDDPANADALWPLAMRAHGACLRLLGEVEEASYELRKVAAEVRRIPE